MTGPVPRWLCALDRLLSAPGALGRAVWAVTAPVAAVVAEPLVYAAWYGMIAVLFVMCAWCCLLVVAVVVPGIPVPPLDPDAVADMGATDALLGALGAVVSGFFVVCLVAEELEDRWPAWRDRCRAARGREA
jgi:hypothetical protein